MKIASWTASLLLCLAAPLVSAAELTEADFRSDGPLGSRGAKIAKVKNNHFKITLGHAPRHPGWANYLQFHISRHARGNELYLTVEFHGETDYAFPGNFYSWSHDRKNWQRMPGIGFGMPSKTSKSADNVLTRTVELHFPAFQEDTVWFGHQVPMAYEDMVELIDHWKQSPAVKVHTLGKSEGGRNLYRLEITDPKSLHVRERRWVHYFANQHPGEYNAMWRMAGMINWLLSDEGADARQRAVCHFVLMQSPDGPANGWLRTNAQGIDMNRAYARGGATRGQGHEPYIWQRDLEGLMSAEPLVDTVWSMHVWPGAADPHMLPGPLTLDQVLGPPARFGEILASHDPGHKLVKKLKMDTRVPRREEVKKWTPPAQVPASWGDTWSTGPCAQFGLSAFLCEGGGDLYSKEENLQSGVVLIKSLMEYWRGLKPARQ
jgi:hypothetical protein